MKETEKRSIGYTESKIRLFDLSSLEDTAGNSGFRLIYPSVLLFEKAGWRGMLIRYDFYSDTIRHLVDNFIQDILDNVAL